VAGTAVGCLAGYLCNIAYMDSDCRQGAAGAKPPPQPLVARASVRHCRGLTTSPIPHRTGVFQIEFDFIKHELDIQTDWGGTETMQLTPAASPIFYRDFMARLRTLGLDVKIWPVPVEIRHPIRFDQDREHASYDSENAHRFWRILESVDRILKEFRSHFTGKARLVLMC